MKVSETQGSVLPRGPGKPVQKEKTEGNFQNVMEQAVRQADHGKQSSVPLVNSAPVAGDVQIVRGVQKMRGPSDLTPRYQVLGELERALDLVDSYANRLADTSLPASRMNPLVRELEDRMKILRGMGDSEDLPSEMKSIISDLLITMGTEIAKFRRGDYV